MAAFRLFVTVFLLSCERSTPRVAPPGERFDLFTLATCPLPATIRLHRHPREISTARVREITRGRLG
jgi:hypothetical protein